MVNKVLAIVNGKKITQADIEETLKRIPPQQAMQFQSEKGREQLLLELIKQQLVYAEAIDNMLHEEEEFIEQIEQMKAEMLKQYAIHKFFSSIVVDQEAVSNYYKENKDNFKAGDSTKASHILVENEEMAYNVCEEIKKGREFHDVAKEYSSCPSKEVGGDLGFFERGQMVPEFEEAAFSLDENQISGPVKTQFGYHIIKVIDKKPARVQSLEDVADEIKKQLEIEKQNELFQKKINLLENKYKIEIL